MSTINRQTTVGWRTEVVTLQNRFTGCIRDKCPNLQACMSNERLSSCPINADCFDQERKVTHNDLLDSFFNKVADLLAGAANPLDLEIKYLSVGTGTAETVGDEEQLYNEIYRNVPVDLQRPLVGKVTAYGFIHPDFANGALREWAWIVGDATGDLGTGKAVNRWLTAVDKTSEDTVVVQYSIIGANAE